MYCEKCGKFVPDNARFCGNCGWRTAQENLVHKAKERKNGWFYIVLVVFFVLFIMMFLLLQIKNSTIEKKKQSIVKEENENVTQSKKDIVINSNEIVVSAIETKTIQVNPITDECKNIGAAEILNYSGNIIKEKQIDTYEYVIPRDGRYRIELQNMQAGVYAQINVYDEKGNCVSPNGYGYAYGNNKGFTLRGLEEGEIYKIQICQSKGYSEYELKIGQQKEYMDISDVTQIADSVEYTEQRNVYSFTVPRDGRYRFEMAGMQSGTYVELFAFNELGETVASYEHGCDNGKGITLKGLKAGEKYEIQVRQKQGISDYILLVGQQKEYIDVTDVTDIKDSVQFTDQRNVYYFTPSVDGIYRFELAEMNAETNLDIYVFNDLYEILGEKKVCKNGDGVTVDKLLAGNTYEIQVIQNKNFGSYQLEIGKQKPIVDVFDGCIIRDSIEYCSQKNCYRFIPEKDGSYVIELSGMLSGLETNLSVTNNLNETIDLIENAENGSRIFIRNVNAGQVFQIESEWCEGYGEYTLKLSKTE